PRPLRRRVLAAAVRPVLPARHELVGTRDDAAQRAQVVGGAELGQERRVAGGLRALVGVLERQRLLGVAALAASAARAADVAGQAARDVLPRLRVAVADADTARSWRVLPEVVEGAVDRRLRDVVAGKARLGLRRQAVVEYRPVRPALALEALVVHVLVEVDE